MTTTSLRIGKPPSRSRRRRLARALNQGGRYLVAYALTGWACMWLVDVHLFVPGMVLAAMLANPWRPKRPMRPVEHGLRTAFHFLLRGLAVAHGKPLSASLPRVT